MAHPMSEFKKIGPERCLMNKPDPAINKVRWLTRFVNGSERIRILSEAGWVIVPDPRNHVVNDYGQNRTEPVRRGRPKKLSK